MMNLTAKYLKIEQWLRKRYTKNGLLAIDVGGKPTKYKRLEELAWCKYIHLQQKEVTNENKI